MTEIVLNTNTLPEPLSRPINADKAKVSDIPALDETQGDSPLHYAEEAKSSSTIPGPADEQEIREVSGFCLFGAKALAALLNKLSDQEEGVRGFEAGKECGGSSGDVEYLHRMRVFARRILVALPLFQECLCADKSEFRRWRRAVRRLARSLGEARDTDVQIAAIIRELEEMSSKDTAGLKRLLLRLRQKRAAMQKNVVRALDRFAESDAEGEVMSRIRLIVGQAFMEELDAKSREQYPGEHMALTAVKERIAQVMSFGVPLPASLDTVQLHEMRKSLKRLRYTLEIFAPVYGDKLKNHVGRIKSLQDILGALHDCDVWLANLPVFIEEERGKTLAYQGHARGLGRVLRGLQDFADVKTQTRKDAYASFTELWEKFCNERWWEGILKELK